MSNRVDLLRHDKPQKTCRDCYHWMACKTMLEAMGFVVDGDGKDADKRCNEFQAAADFAPVVHADADTEKGLSTMEDLTSAQTAAQGWTGRRFDAI